MNSSDRTAIALTALVAAVVGVVIGYFIYAAAEPESSRFRYWIQSPVFFGGLWWAIGGLLIGAAIGYIRLLERR